MDLSMLFFWWHTTVHELNQQKGKGIEQHWNTLDEPTPQNI